MVYVIKSLKWPAVVLSLTFLGCFALVVSGIIFPYSGLPNPHSQRILYQVINSLY